MGILDFIKKLLPRVNRSDIADDLRTTEKEMTKIVMPSYQQAADAFRTIKLQSVEVESLQAVFSANFKANRHSSAKNFIIDINIRLKNLLENMTYMSTLLDTVVDKDIITSGLTTRSAFVLRSASNMSFLSRYMLSLLNYIYTVEANSRDVEVEPSIEISKAEVKYVENKFHAFVKLFAQYSAEPEEFKKLYEAIPDLIANERTNKMLAAMLESKEADPLASTGYSGFVGSPIYTVRLAFAQWQNSRYESAKAKKQQLEFRLLYLENQAKNRKDPALMNEIQRLQDRIEKLDYQLAETDTELGL